MILQALNDYYETLAARGQIARRGWSSAKVVYALTLGEDGALLDVLPLRHEVQQGKKTVLAPIIMEVPEQLKRTVGVAANFLCDNSGYLLGVDAKGKPERTRKCFQAAKQLHERLLESVDSPAARAVHAFFQTWNPDAAQNHPALRDSYEDITAGGNLVFRFRERFVHDDPLVQASWDQRADEGQGQMGRCLVTGQRAPIAAVHPAIKGVRGAQAVGAALVSFNAAAFESYEKSQSVNASVGEPAAFAYTTALNHLIADTKHTRRMGDTTVLYWAQNADPVYQDAFGYCVEPSFLEEDDIKRALDTLSKGKPYDLSGKVLRPETHFYVLGLSPNAARLSVRFFYHNQFGEIMENINRHYKRLAIERPAYDERELLSIYSLLYETANPNSRDKLPPAILVGALFRAILEDQPYPAFLFQDVMMRIRAERSLSRGRAAILKAYLSKWLEKSPNPPMEEVVNMEVLNDESNYLPYVLGRLFSVLEAVQQAANPGINTTIRDRYFNSASATPATIFPLLTKLSQSHLRKLDTGLRVFYEKQIVDLQGRIQRTLPDRLTLPEQGTFHLGYYHQTQKNYTKKNKGESDNG